MSLAKQIVDSVKEYERGVMARSGVPPTATALLMDREAMSAAIGSAYLSGALAVANTMIQADGADEVQPAAFQRAIFEALATLRGVAVPDKPAT